MRTDCFDRIQALYEQKREHLADYLEMVRTENNMLRENRSEEMAAVLAAKDKMIARINSLDGQLSKAFQPLLSAAGKATRAEALALPGAAAAARAAGRVASLLAEIKPVEDDNLALLQKMKDGLAQTLREIQAGRGAAAAYRSVSGQADGTFIDRRE